MTRPPHMPATTPDYMAQAWVDCLRWAIGEPGIVQQFRETTGIAWEPGRTAIDRMIDDVTGADRHFAMAFVEWFNVHVWGDVTADAEETGR